MGQLLLFSRILLVVISVMFVHDFLRRRVLGSSLSSYMPSFAEEKRSLNSTLISRSSGLDTADASDALHIPTKVLRTSVLPNVEEETKTFRNSVLPNVEEETKTDYRAVGTSIYKISTEAAATKRPPAKDTNREINNATSSSSPLRRTTGSGHLPKKYSRPKKGGDRRVSSGRKPSSSEIEDANDLKLLLSNKRKKTSRNNTRVPRLSKSKSKKMVQPRDSIYRGYAWDSAPIILESHQLVFFTVPKVGCTVWKQLFRRMMGYPDWALPKGGNNTHNPGANGLRYLRDYPLRQANEMMTSANWTRAIFVRDPKERFLSAYFEKARLKNGTYLLQNMIKTRGCCRKFSSARSCVKNATESPSIFFSFIASGCDDPHWRRQDKRMESKYWPQLNFVGHMETAAQDAKELLTRIGAWEEFGKTGWGSKRKEPIFAPTAQKTVQHATHASSKMLQWYTPELEQKVEDHYRADYANRWLNLTLTRIFNDQATNRVVDA